MVMRKLKGLRPPRSGTIKTFPTVISLPANQTSNLKPQHLSANILKTKMSSLSCLAHVKRFAADDGSIARPSAPPLACFTGSTWDRSGSMASMGGSVGPAFYDWVKDACSQAIQLGQHGFLFATTFDATADQRLVNVPVRDVEISLRDATSWVEPRGCTRLYDTAIEDIARLRRAAREFKANLPRETRDLEPQIVTAWSLMTDGMDNHSQFTEADLRTAVSAARADGMICFFLAANCDGQARGADYGFDQDMSLTFTADRQCSDTAFRGISTQLRAATSGASRAACALPALLRSTSQAPPSPITPPRGARFSSAPTQNLRVGGNQLRQPAFPSTLLRQNALSPPRLRRC